MKKKTRLSRDANLPADTFSIVRHHFHQFPLILHWISWNFKEWELQLDHDKECKPDMDYILSAHYPSMVCTLSKNCLQMISKYLHTTKHDQHIYTLSASGRIMNRLIAAYDPYMDHTWIVHPLVMIWIWSTQNSLIIYKISSHGSNMIRLLSEYNPHSVYTWPSDSSLMFCILSAHKTPTWLTYDPHMICKLYIHIAFGPYKTHA